MRWTETVSASDRIRLRDGLWFTFALLLHAALLLIPAQQSAVQRAAQDPLAVHVILARRDMPVKPDEDTHDPTRRELIEPRPLVREKSPDPALPETIGQRDDFMAGSSRSKLLDSLSRLQETPGADGPARQLGDKPLYRPPANWRPRDTLGENTPADGLSPRSTGTIDRWLAADGSHNVVVQTAGGDRICGRAEAWNPMNPLLEPVMMFRKCGESGKRRFSMPARFMRSQREHASRGAFGIK
jgi:hypothetical protein